MLFFSDLRSTINFDVKSLSNTYSTLGRPFFNFFTPNSSPLLGGNASNSNISGDLFTPVSTISILFFHGNQFNYNFFQII